MKEIEQCKLNNPVIYIKGPMTDISYTIEIELKNDVIGYNEEKWIKILF